MFLAVRGVPSPRPAAERIAPQADVLLPDTSGGQDVDRTDSIAMPGVTTGTPVGSVLCVVQAAALRASLTGVRRIDVYHTDTYKGGLVLDVRGQAIEAPAMEATVVFTACSCRCADVGELLQLDGCDAHGYGVTDDSSAELVVLVPHPPLLLVVELTDGAELLRLAKLLANLGVPAPHKLVVATVAIEASSSCGGHSNRRTLDPEVNGHSLAFANGRFCRLVGDLSNVLVALLADAQSSQFDGCQHGGIVRRYNCRNSDALTFAVYPEGSLNAVVEQLEVLVVPDSYRLPQNGKLPGATQRLAVDASGISTTLVAQGGRQGSFNAGGAELRHIGARNGVVQDVVHQGDVLPHGDVQQSRKLRRRN